MKFDVNIYHHHDLEDHSLLEEILKVVNEIKEKGGVSIMKLDELEKQVTDNTTVEQSAIVLIQGIAAQLVEIATDPAKIQALADQLKNSAANLAACIQTNTVPV